MTKSRLQSSYSHAESLVRQHAAFRNVVIEPGLRLQPEGVLRILMSLAEGDAGESALTLSMGWKQPRVNKLLSRLAEAGWIQPWGDVQDRRRNIYLLSAKGREKLKEIERALAGSIRR